MTSLRPTTAPRQSDLERILRFTKGEYTIPWVLQELLSHRLEAYDIVQEGQQIGTLLLSTPMAGVKKVLYVFGLAVQGRAWHADVAAALRSIARSRGCASIRGRSPRAGWARFGKPVATEYELELQA
jgi:hypothetical protein